MIKNLRFLTLALLSIVFNVAMADPGYMEVKFVGTEDAIEVINDAEGNAVGFKHPDRVGSRCGNHGAFLPPL